MDWVRHCKGELKSFMLSVDDVEKKICLLFEPNHMVDGPRTYK